MPGSLIKPKKKRRKRKRKKRKVVVKIKKLKVAHGKALYALVKANRDHLSTFDSMERSEYRSEAGFIRTIKYNPDYPNRTRYGVWVGDAIVGEVFADPSYKNVEVGFWIAKQYTRKGYAIQALRLLVALLKNSGIGCVVAITLRENTPSRSMLKAAGFFLSDKKWDVYTYTKVLE
ncbi:MAG: GNAT family N-acetyltransferase [Patescibacteria group bacterium]